MGRCTGRCTGTPEDEVGVTGQERSPFFPVSLSATDGRSELSVYKHSADGLP